MGSDGILASQYIEVLKKHVEKHGDGVIHVAVQGTAFPAVFPSIEYVEQDNRWVPLLIT